LTRLARELGLEARTFSLEYADGVRRGLEGIRLVLLAAGPFVRTSRPVVSACLDVGVHYVDITGEPSVLEEVYEKGGEAERRGVVLLPGAGMDVLPSDGLAALLAARVPGAESLELAHRSGGRASGGTLRTVLEHAPAGLLVRREGRLVGARPGGPGFRREVDFGPGRGGGVRPVVPFTWGDLASGPRTTGIGNVTCYKASGPAAARLIPWALPLLRAVLGIRPLRVLAQRAAGTSGTGPDEETRRRARTRIWARVAAPDGRAAEAVLETMEGYRFTAVAGVRVVEEVLARTAPPAPGRLAGALTPAGAFGPSWILGLPETRLVRG
jgi:short subunit dehydrogenase-like uncharacterized protein